MSLSLTRFLFPLVLVGSALAQVPPCFEVNLGANLQLGDDAVAQGRALGFAFPFPGGSVSAIDISSNGFVWLGSNSDNGCCDGNLANFLSSTARIAPGWFDLDPSSGGAVHFATFPGRAVVTWSGVPEYSQSEALTMQLQLLSDGTFSLFWQTPFLNRSHTCLIGVTPGNNAANARALDFANALPFNSTTSSTVYEVFSANAFDLSGRVITFALNGQGGYSITRRTDCRFASFITNGIGCPPGLPVTLAGSFNSRPAIGTNFDMIVGEAPNGATLGAMLYGTATSTSLAPIGMIGCTQYSSAAVTMPFVVQGRYSIATLPIPNQAGLVGARVAAQAALVAPLANPAGIVTSNGGNIEIGT